MTGMERILTALDRKQPDRVPLYIHGINEKPIVGIAREWMEDLPDPDRSFYDMTDGEKFRMLEALFQIHERHGIDGFTALEFGHEKRIGETEVQDAWGVVYRMNPFGLPVAKVHPVPDAKALAAYRPPSPRRDGLLLLMAARDRFRGEKALFWMMRGTFVLGWRLAGMENWMLQMFDDPAFIHDLGRMTCEYNLELLDLLVREGLHVLIVEDDIADRNGPLVSPEQFREFIHPWNRRIVEAARSRGLRVVRHSDGNLWPLLDTLLESGYDGLNPLEPQAGMDLRRVKAYCGDRLCLLGNIDCVDLLPNGTPEEVEAAVREAISAAGVGGGYILCDSNTLHPGVRPENCTAMFTAARRYGTYPLEGMPPGETRGAGKKTP